MIHALTALALVAIFATMGCQRQPVEPTRTERSTEWLWSEPVKFVAYHDPWMIWLEDGRKLQVQFGGPAPTAIKWDEADAWPRGRALRLAFSAASGPVLIDEATSARIPIIAGLEVGHPLDRMLERNLENSPDTISIAESYAANRRHWETEIDRIYEIAAQDPRVRSAVEAAAQSWREFSSTQFKAAGALHALPAGTMWTINHAQFALSLTRTHALSLMSLLEAIASAEPAEISPEIAAPSAASAAPAPNPEDFACSYVFSLTPVSVDLASHPQARTFRSELGEQARRSADFAGYYVAASWGCGSPCQQWALIDSRDGKVYFAPFTTALGGRFSLNSRLFIADAPEEISAYYRESGGKEPKDEPLFATTYWEWIEARKEFQRVR